MLIHSQSWRFVTAALSGLLYALAYPPLGWSWLIVPAIAGLLAALRNQHGSRAGALGFIHGLSAAATSLSWLHHIFDSFAIVLWCVVALFPALFAGTQSRAALRGIAGWRFALFTAINWSAWEFIRAELFPLKFPWMTVGLAVGPNCLLPWIGVYGVGFVVVLSITLLMARKWKPSLAIFALWIGATLWIWPVPDPSDQADAVRVAALQYENVPIETLIDATRALPNNISHAVWPEYSVPYDVRAHKKDWSVVQELVRERGITLTFGTQARSRTNGTWRNIALTLDPSGIRGEHTKVHTVHYFDDGTAGTTALPVATANGETGTPVCFDCDFHDVTRKMTAAGARMFVVPVMDAAPWSATQHEQHAGLFRIRACENHRWMLVCASSGITQLIDPHGIIHHRLDPLAEATLTGTMAPDSRLTFFTRAGWIFPYIILATAVAFWLLLLLPRPKKQAPVAVGVIQTPAPDFS